MSITKTQAQSVVKKTQAEATKLQPSAAITLIEIDLTDLLFERNFIDSTTGTNIQEEQIKVFRFHNNINLFNSNIKFQGNTYYALPIQITGLELTGSGTLPTPELTISTLEEDSAALSLLKCQIAALSDLVGAKVTIHKTMLKFLHQDNFIGRRRPDDFDGDESEFPAQVFYVDQKMEESKLTLKYRLNSILDLYNTKIPRCLIFGNKCRFHYRGQGCAYEYSDSKVNGPSRLSELHNGVNEKYLGRNGYAPPVSNGSTKFVDVVGVDYQKLDDTDLSLYDRGEHSLDEEYTQGQFVYISKNGINYYFVAKKFTPKNIQITNRNHWEPDICNKSISDCQMRFGKNLPFGGYAGTEKLTSR